MSLRPLPVGAIAVYCHAAHISIAVDPPKAAALRASTTYQKQIPKTPATTYIVVGDGLLAHDFEDVLELAVESVDWRVQGPQTTLGAGHNSKVTYEPEVCPNCWNEITAAGACWCD